MVKSPLDQGFWLEVAELASDTRSLNSKFRGTSLQCLTFTSVFCIIKNINLLKQKYQFTKAFNCCILFLQVLIEKDGGKMKL